MKDQVRFNPERLQTARKEAGLSQVQVASLMQIARTSIVAIEQGKRKVSRDELERFAKLYGVEVGWLQGAADIPATTVHVHIYLGYSASEREPGEECFYCGARPDRLAYTYLGAPLCRDCWDNHWRKTEDGQTDPPFDDIHNILPGYWIR